MKVYKTQSGSTYYVDEANRQIRREGKQGVTERATTAWRKYASVSDTFDCLFIVWDKDTPLLPGSPDDAWATTLTTRIVSCKEES